MPLIQLREKRDMVNFSFDNMCNTLVFVCRRKILNIKKRVIQKVLVNL